MRQLTIAGLLGAALAFLTVFISLLDSEVDVVLLVVTSLLFAGAAVAALPWRFAPLAGPLVGGAVCLVSPFFQPYTLEDLAHPEHFGSFAAAVLMTVFGLIATVCGLWAALAPRRDGRTRPRWLSAFLGGAAGIAAGAGLVAWASTAGGAGAAGAATNQVLMTATAFDPETVTLPTGAALVLVDAVDGEPHVLFSRAAGLDGDEVSDGAVAAGPFREPGAFQIICTIHEGMRLAVTVE